MDVIIRNYEGTREEILSDVDKGSFSRKIEENQTYELDFDVTQTERNKIAFDLVQHESSILFDGQEFIIKQMSSNASGSSVTKSITGAHIYTTMQDGYQYNTLTGRRSISQLLSHVFGSENLGFTWEVIDPEEKFSTVEQENFGGDNYLKLVQEIIEDYDATMLVDNKHLSFYPRGDYGKKINEPIRYKYNTDSVDFDIDTLNLKTQIRGFGKQDDDDNYFFDPIVYTSPEAERWGIRIQDPIEDDRYTVAGNMKKRLKKELNDKPDVSGSVSLKFNSDINIFDWVPFIYEPINLNTYIQVVGITDYPFLPNEPLEVTLSNTKKTMTSILANLTKKGVL
ncbi:phage tail protein [Tetragenococcus halophilus]|uniref:phage tail protein n=1 Tax=Tetragenococcus halophilus TaxID=51669 RepID=UPI0015B8271D|nr:phage tail protein [Tetragenococcus halophilus]NWN99251.1 phage tail protein [Tetragenococcus halophilus]